MNKKGLFNVPMGAYKKPLICDVNNLTAISLLLKNVTIHCGDYKKCLAFIDSNTFVYIDPPYRPLTATAMFTSYAEADFNDKEQRELGAFVDTITDKNAELDRLIRLYRMTEQDYIIDRLNNKEIIVNPNPRVFKALKNEIVALTEELKRLSEVSKDNDELFEMIRAVTGMVEKLSS